MVWMAYPLSENQLSIRQGQMVASHVRNGSRLHEQKIDGDGKRIPVVFDNSIYQSHTKKKPK